MKKEISEKHTSNEIDTHRLCYIECGNAKIKNVKTIGIFIPGPPGYGIGFVSADLIGWENVLKVVKVFRTKVYDHSVHVKLIGFIGYVYPTVSVYGGILQGRAIIAIVWPLS